MTKQKCRMPKELLLIETARCCFVIRHSSFVINAGVERERKSRSGQCGRRGVEVVPRLFDVGYHFSRFARCARWSETIAAQNSLRDARSVALPGPATSEMRENLRRHER